jgi:hypothetical protein
MSTEYIKRQKEISIKKLLGQKSSEKVKAILLLSLIDEETSKSIARKLLSLAR